MKTWMKTAVLLLVVTVILMTAALALSGPEKWELNLNPEVVDFTTGGAASTVTVTLAYSGTTGDEGLVVYCPPPSGGEIITASAPAFLVPLGLAANNETPDLQDLQSLVDEGAQNLQGEGPFAVFWSGTLPNAGSGELPLFTFTVEPSGPTTFGVECWLYEEGTRVQQTPVEIAVIPYRMWMPIMFQGDGQGPAPTPTPTPPPTPGSTYTVTVSQIKSVDSWGYSHSGAFAPDGSGVYAGGTSIATMINTLESGEFYLISRTYMEITLPQFTGEALTARLIGPAQAGWYTSGDPLPAPEVSLHQGTWTASQFPDDKSALWGHYGVEVGRLDTSSFFGASLHDVEVELDVTNLDLQPGGTLRLVLRDSEDHINLRNSPTEENRYFDGSTWSLVLEVSP